MATGVGLVNPKVQFLDDNGVPLADGTVQFYIPGTLTPRDTFSDVGLTTPNANPLTLDGAGRATIYFDSTLGYKFDLKDANGVEVYTQDSVILPGPVYAISSDGTTWFGRVLAAVSTTAGVNLSLNGHTFSSTLNKAASGTQPSFFNVVVNAPIIAGGGATVLNAASLVVSGAPTGAVTNLAFLVFAGASRFQGSIQMLTDVQHGISFDDSLVTGIVGTSVGAYIGPDAANTFVLRTSTPTPIILGINGVDVAKIRDTGLSLVATAVAHGMTTIVETSAYGLVTPNSPTDGGMRIAGLTETTVGLTLIGYVGAATATPPTSGSMAPFVFNAGLKSGTTAASLGSGQMIAVMQNAGTTVFGWNTNGDAFYHGSAAASFDEWNDVALARSLDLTLKRPGVIETAWDKYCDYNRDDLERAGIITADGFVNAHKHSQLLNGSIWQLFVKIQELTGRIAELGSRLEEYPKRVGSGEEPPEG